MAYPTQRAHANVVFDALDSNAFVKLIGGNSVDPNLAHSDVAHFLERSMVPAGQNTDKVAVRYHDSQPKKDVENDSMVRFSLGFVGSILRSEEPLAARHQKNPKLY